MIKKQLLLSLLVMVSHIQTGVYVVAELPRKVTGVIQEAQDALSKRIAMLNERNGGNYIFQNTQFSPHLTLSYVSKEKLPIQKVKRKFPGLIEELQQIAGKHSSIDLSKNFADAVIDYWPGTFKVKCGGSIKNNYWNVVLKLSNNRAFTNLAQDVSKTLKDKYNIEQTFPFSAHVTIGIICEKNDNPIDESLKQKLEPIVIGTKKKTTVSKPLSIMIGEFKLKSHDGAEEKFALFLSHYAPKTSLMDASERGDVKRMRKLIAEGADVNAIYDRDQPRMGYPVLRFAIESKSTAVVELLLKHGANPNEHTTSPIMHRKRSSANVRNLPLLSYAIYSHAPYRIIKLLIDYGADVNQKTVFNEWTPLMVAAYATNVGAVELLVKAGADCKATNCRDGNRTAHDYAKENTKSYTTASDEEKRIDNKEIMRTLYWCMHPPNPA